VENSSERRKEKRLRYHWPVWFAEDFDGVIFHGQMIDVSSDAACFTYQADEDCPYLGQELTTRFSIPCYDKDGGFDLANFARSAKVFRIDESSHYIRRIAVQFSESLPFRPGHQGQNDSDHLKFSAVTI
jgi:hypothetical protein